MSLRGLCLSVYAPVTFVDSVERNNHIFTIFTPSGSHSILVFPCHGNIPTVTPITGHRMQVE